MPGKKDRPLSLATIDRIFLKAKCTPPDMAAAEALGKLLEQFAIEILEAANVLTKQARRKTITDADITLAYDHWREKAMKKDSATT